MLSVRLSGTWFTLCVAALWVLAPEAIKAQVAYAPRALTQNDTAMRGSFKFYASPLWTRSSGFGAGVGYEIRNLGMPHGSLLATATPAQHVGRYTLTYFARDPFVHPVYGLANVYFETAGRQPFYGLGPESSRHDRIAVEKTRFEAEVRVGVHPPGGPVFVQPVLRYVRHEVVDFRDWNDGAAFDRLSPASQTNLLFSAGELPGATAVQEGLVFGLSAGIDLRDRRIRTRRGAMVQTRAERYAFREPDGLTFNRFGIFAYGFVPIGDHSLALRSVAEFTRDRGEVPIPFYLLPSLHGHLLPGYALDRFVGNDLFVFTVEYAHMVFELFNVAALDAILSLGAGNAYDDLFDQFESSVTFDGTLSPDGDRFPLRPSIALGFALQSLSALEFDLRALLGWTPEGIFGVRFAFVHDLRGIVLGKR